MRKYEATHLILPLNNIVAPAEGFTNISMTVAANPDDEIREGADIL